MKVGQLMTEPVSYTHRKIEQFHETFWKEYDNEYLESFGSLRAKSSFKKDAHVLSGLFEREKEKCVRGENLNELSMSKIDSSIGKMRVSLADEQDQHRNFKKDKETQNKQPFLFKLGIKEAFKESEKNNSCSTSEMKITIDEYMDLNSSKQSIIEPINDAGQHNFEKEDVQDFMLLSEKEEKVEKMIKKEEAYSSSSSSSSEQDQSEGQRVGVENIFKERGKEDEGRTRMVKAKASDEKKECALPQKDSRQQLSVLQPMLSLGNYRAKVLDIQQKFMISVDLSFRTISSYITSLEANRTVFPSQVKYAVRQDQEEDPEEDSKEDPRPYPGEDPEEDSKENSKEDSKENSKEDSKEDQKEDSKEDSKEERKKGTKEERKKGTKEKVNSSNPCKKMGLVQPTENYPGFQQMAIESKRQLFNKTNLSEPPRARDHYSSSQEEESSSEDQK